MEHVNGLIWGVVEAVVSLAILKFAINLLFPGLVTALLDHVVGSPPKGRGGRKVRVKLKEETVFQVSDIHGKYRIVVAKGEDDAAAMGKEALAAEEVFVTEVYDKVLRK